ncbi:ABC transporter permease [Longispora fulva]|uniref:Putative ABC transport system permease protein n=1 Tax=Longispora fulva TaxID=619741 RepID=A0A8J7GSW8_9ACTN|nr:ABC transporter permease [Longispora fulva]MBG6136486.1 putative ABC transport system permease protein [Longispora fulva]GIG59655.1 ABC transporter permease [Longispora fulva]
MGDATIRVGPVLFAVLVLLAVTAAGLAALGRLGSARDILTASARAAVQLAAVSLLIAAVLRSGWWTALFVSGMAVVAIFTSARRITSHRSGGWTALPIGVAVVPVLALLLGSTLVPARPIAVVPIAGILIGGAMTATSLTGRRALDELEARVGEYEAGLALGMVPRRAAIYLCRTAAKEALIPALDQTRTVGLVTLPGAFVGVLLGGASPVRAGATQLLVLVALLAVETVAVLVTAELVARRRLSRPSGAA